MDSIVSPKTMVEFLCQTEAVPTLGPVYEKSLSGFVLANLILVKMMVESYLPLK